MTAARAAPERPAEKPHEPFARWNQMVLQEKQRQLKERTKQEEQKNK